MTAVALAHDSFSGLFGDRRGGEREQDQLNARTPSDEARAAAQRLYAQLAEGIVTDTVTALRDYHHQLRDGRPILDALLSQLAGELVKHDSTALGVSGLMKRLGLHRVYARSIRQAPEGMLHLLLSPDGSRTQCGTNISSDWREVRRGAWRHPQNRCCAKCAKRRDHVAESWEQMDPHPLGEEGLDQVNEDTAVALANHLAEVWAQDRDLGFEAMRSICRELWWDQALDALAAALAARGREARALLLTDKHADRGPLAQKCWRAILADARPAGSAPKPQACMQAITCLNGACKH